MKFKEFDCCICGARCTGWGNNPEGAMWLDPESLEPVIGEFDITKDRCCDECNLKYVIPGRIQQARQSITISDLDLK